MHDATTWENTDDSSPLFFFFPRFLPKMIPIAFDVLGTCFSLDAAIVALDALFQDQFAAKKINPKLIVEDWFHTSQRDFTCRSLSHTFVESGPSNPGI